MSQKNVLNRIFAVSLVILVLAVIGIGLNMVLKTWEPDSDFTSIDENQSTSVSESPNEIPEIQASSHDRELEHAFENSDLSINVGDVPSHNVEIESGATSELELTTFHGEMTKRPLVESAPNTGSKEVRERNWISTDLSGLIIPSDSEVQGRDWFFAWVHLHPDYVKADLESEFKNFDLVVFDGYSDLRRAQLPISKKELEDFLNHDAVIGIGSVPPEQKIRPNLWELINNSIPDDTAQVYVALMSEQGLTAWKNEIRHLSGVVDSWDASIGVLHVSIPFKNIEQLASKDFVQAIERVELYKSALDSAAATAGADGVRTYADSPGAYTGVTGSGIAIGVMDTGLNINHPDISTGRLSICGEVFATLANGQLDEDDLWIDANGHGTHVTGIAAGNGYMNSGRAGMAPGASHIRFAKAFDKSSGYTSSNSILSGMDWFSQDTSCQWNGQESEAIKPNVINMSLGAVTKAVGNWATARKLDHLTWHHNQVYVVSVGNEGTQGYSEFAASKNSVSVGNVYDSNLINSTSSWGPTADSRLIPNVSMVGTDVYSARGEGATSGYEQYSGTSMSSPAVAGVVALMMEAVPEFKDYPALVRAQLMASAIRPDRLIGSGLLSRTGTGRPGAFTWQYGLGVVSARTAITQSAENGWVSGSAISELADDEYAFIEIEVPENTSRLDIVLTWDDPPNDHFGDAVIADLDLYLGPNSDCNLAECAEIASRSGRDNVEYVILTNPSAGTKRISVVPFNVYQHKPRAAVAWVAITGASTPKLSVATDVAEMNAANVKRPQVKLTISNDSYVSSGTTLYFGCRAADVENCSYWYDSKSRWQPGSQVMREDGTIQDISGLNINFPPVFIGEIAAGEEREVTLVFPPTIRTTSHQIYFTVAGFNSESAVASVDVVVDDTELDPSQERLANDQMGSAQLLEGTGGDIEVDFLGSSREPGEWMLYRAALWGGGQWPPEWVTQSEYGWRQPRSVWYQVQSPDPARYRLSLTSIEPEDSSFIMYVFAFGDMFQHQQVARSTEGEVEFFVSPNYRYLVWIGSANHNIVPKATFSWNKLDPRPINDDFADRTTIENESGEVSGNNTFATVEKGEPGGYQALASTWYTWTAPSNGFFEFAIESSNSEGHSVQIYSGTELSSLRLLSDTTWIPAMISADSGETYQIAVTSWNEPQAEYDLSWLRRFTGASAFATNDQFSNATSLDGITGTAAKCPSFSCSGDRRTVEIGEPLNTNSHSQWWSWSSTTTGTFTWRLQDGSVDTLSMFRGSALDDLVLIGTGQEVVAGVDADETIYIAIHRKPGLNYFSDWSDNTISWGSTPVNDNIDGSIALSGASGSSTASLKYASSQNESLADGITSAGVYSSAWYTWTAPAFDSRWMKFSVESWNTAGLDSNSDQYYLGIHRQKADESGYELVASIDRSFIASGDPQAIFLPEDGTEYFVQVALRANGETLSDTDSEVDFSWEETTAPAYLSANQSVVEIGSNSGNDMLELSDPHGAVVAGNEQDQLLIKVDSGLLNLKLGGDDDLSIVETLSVVDGSGGALSFEGSSAFAWSAARQSMYVALNDGFIVFEGYEQSDRLFSKCTVETDFNIEPTQLIAGHSGRFLYKVGSGTVAMYRIDAPCEITLTRVLSNSTANHTLKIQDSSLAGLEGMALKNSDDNIYGVAESELITIAIDSGTENMEVSTKQTNSAWLQGTDVHRDYFSSFNSAMTTVDSTGNFLFAVGKDNVSVAVFDLATDPTQPAILGAKRLYNIAAGSFFPSHIIIPLGTNVWPYDLWNRESCNAFTVHGRNHTGIDVFCKDRFYVASWDSTASELNIVDWATDRQPDRYGNVLPDFAFMDSVSAFQSGDGRFAYVIIEDWVDAVHRFERVSGSAEIPPPSITAYETYIVRLVAMTVSTGSIVLGGTTLTDCQEISETTIDDVTYTVHNSKWQTRSRVGATWEDVSGTVRTDSQLCSYSPGDSADYRMAFEMTIDGERANYSSNVMSSE